MVGPWTQHGGYRQKYIFFFRTRIEPRAPTLFSLYINVRVLSVFITLKLWSKSCASLLLFFFTLRDWSKSCVSLFLYLERLKKKLCFFFSLPWETEEKVVFLCFLSWETEKSCVSLLWEPEANVLFLCFFTLRGWSKSCVCLFFYLESLKKMLCFFVSLPWEPGAKVVFLCFRFDWRRELGCLNCLQQTRVTTDTWGNRLIYKSVPWISNKWMIS